MGGFSGMDPAGFRTRRRSTVTKGEDLRWVKVWILFERFKLVFDFHSYLLNNNVT